MNTGFLKTLALSLCLFGIISCNVSGTQNTGTGSDANVASTEKVEAGQAAAAPVELDKAIRKIDFKNFTYEPFCAGEESEKVTVKDGEYSKETKDKDSDFVDRFYFNVNDVTYGDVDGDSKEDAIILTNCNTGGTGQFSEGFIYSIKSGKAALLDRIEGGDRAYGGLRSAKFENGLLLVERNDVGEAGGACCPEFVVTSKYKWNGKKMEESGPDSKKPLYPEERVSFAKGTTKTTIKVSIEDVKRYVVGARAGQTLFVSSNSEKVSVSLIKGDAVSTEGINGFTARLKENGDFVIEAQNMDEKATAVTLTIEIK